MKKLSDLVEGYLDTLRLSRRISPTTERLYGHYLSRFLTHRLELHAAGAEISPQQVNEFLAWLDRGARARRGRQISPWALDKAFDVLRSFCRWCCDNGGMNQNPFQFLKPPIIPERPRPVATREAILRVLKIIAAAPRRVRATFEGTLARGGRRLQPNPEGTRDRALCRRDAALYAACYFAGLRISEACALELERLRLDEGYLQVLGKGGRARSIPIHPILARYLRAWLRDRARILQEADLTNPYVFITMPGRGLRVGSGRGHVDAFRMEHLLAWRYLPLAARSRGRGNAMPSKFTPHAFRHSVATRMLDRGVGLAFVQEFLGHRDPRTTRIYTRVTSKHLRGAVRHA